MRGETVCKEAHASCLRLCALAHDPNNMISKAQFIYRGGMLDALTSASTLLTLIRHADSVKTGWMTSGLNTFAATDAIMSGNRLPVIPLHNSRNTAAALRCGQLSRVIVMISPDMMSFH